MLRGFGVNCLFPSCPQFIFPACITVTIFLDPRSFNIPWLEETTLSFRDYVLLISDDGISLDDLALSLLDHDTGTPPRALQPVSQIRRQETL